MNVLEVKQQNDKFLREYVSVFTLEAIEIIDLSISDTVQTLLKGLKEGLLQVSPLKKAPKDIVELLSRVEKYMNSKETLKFAPRIEVPELNRIKEHSLKRKYNKPRFEKSNKTLRYGSRESQESRPLPLKYHNYTPLNAT